MAENIASGLPSSSVIGGYDWARYALDYAAASEGQSRYDASVAERAPFMEAKRTYATASVGALKKLQDFAAGKTTIQEDPSYKYRLSQGLKALERTAAAKHNLLSGGAGTRAMTLGQNMASQEYQNAYNRLAAAAYTPDPIYMPDWRPGSQSGFDKSLAPSYDDILQKFRDAGGNASGGDSGGERIDSVWVIQGDGTLKEEFDTAYRYKNIWDNPKYGVFHGANKAGAQAAVQRWIDSGRSQGDYYTWIGGRQGVNGGDRNTPGSVWGESSWYLHGGASGNYTVSQTAAGSLKRGTRAQMAALGDSYLGARKGYNVDKYGPIPGIEDWLNQRWGASSPNLPSTR